MCDLEAPLRESLVRLQIKNEQAITEWTLNKKRALTLFVRWRW